MTGVYKIINKQSKKFYIGSSVDIQKRWHNHLYALRKGKHPNPHLQSAWVKYGHDCFIFSVLEKTSKEELTEREQYWLEKENAVADGYNICEEAGKPSEGCKNASSDYWDELTDEEKFELSEKRAQTARRTHAERFNDVSATESWDNEGGAADRWLRKNDPDYGDIKKTGYLTARQYKYRARDKEIPIDPHVMAATVVDTGAAVIHAEGMEWIKKKPRKGELIDY